MEWEGREESENVEDRRTFGPRAIAIGGGIGGAVILIRALVFGLDPDKLAEWTGQGAPKGGAADPSTTQQTRPVDPEEERLAKFSKVVFHDTELIWDELFRKTGKQYQ